MRRRIRWIAVAALLIMVLASVSAYVATSSNHRLFVGHVNVPAYYGQTDTLHMEIKINDEIVYSGVVIPDRTFEGPQNVRLRWGTNRISVSGNHGDYASQVRFFAVWRYNISIQYFHESLITEGRISIHVSTRYPYLM